MNLYLLMIFFKGILIENYIWSFGRSEIYVYNQNKEYHKLSKQTIDGENLKDILCKIYLIVFADIKAFPNQQDICNVNNYSQFLHSSCEIALFISDCNYVEIYSKQEINCRIIFNNVNQLHCNHIEYITDNNDCRTTFSVY